MRSRHDGMPAADRSGVSLPIGCFGESTLPSQTPKTPTLSSHLTTPVERNSDVDDLRPSRICWRFL